jgi:hypothetical protein
MALKKINIGNELGRGWALFKPNMGTLIVAGLICVIVSLVTCGILGGPLMAGMYMVVMRFLKNDPQKPQAGDVFKGFDVFVQALLVIVFTIVIVAVLSVIPVIGQIAGLVVGAVSTWALMFVACGKLTAIDAFKKVFTLTQSGEFIWPLVFVVITNLISGLGAIACGIGVFFTIPLAICMDICCYETLFGGEPEPEVIDPIKVEPPTL